MNATTHNVLRDYQASYHSSHYRPGFAQRIAAVIDIWRRRARDRHAFAQLDDRELHDLGVPQWEVERELSKPFWRA